MMKLAHTARSIVAALVLGAGACTGNIGVAPGPSPGSGPGAEPEPIPPANADVGRVAIHRLNNREYDNTIHDLLGVTSTALMSFISDQTADFDNSADALIITDVSYEQYYKQAETVAGQAFADPALAARILTCAPASATDTTCTRQIISTFGLRAWRRPLEPAEVDRLTTVATDATALGEDFAGSIKQVVTVMLAVPHFLYRIELDPDPSSTARHALGPYELASRLSYLGWSTMPDAQLFALAASGDILRDDVITKQLERMLADPKGATFVESFGGQWLGMRALQSHQVEATAFPDWDEPLRQAMVQEGLRYFQDFLVTNRSLNEFFTADINFVNARLARHYGFSGVVGDAPTKLTNGADQRQGFLGLAGFLTQSSFSYRTAPTLRGKWVLENLLCQTIAPPPAGVPKIDNEMAKDPASQSLNVSAKLAEHRNNDKCSFCHKILDPIGLGLESFDGIGRFRTAYPNGDPVDASGEMPNGETFSGIQQLTGILSRDTRFGDCASVKAMTYALGRAVTDADQPFLDQIRYRWRSGGNSVRALLKAVVLSDTFRYRRGQP
jgi:Protein of unknown function (DUF1592)/Protein of unknown function (DUF1588)/Protein of unknown function (DUF1595)/Protein of unknown function (DUF1585)/Protein of unknown function (DUF1587)